MPDQETLYARWLSGEITPDEEKHLKTSGEWEELEAIINTADTLSLPSYDQDNAYKKLSNNRKETKTATLSPRWIMGIAASLAVLVVAYVFLSRSNVTVAAPYAENIVHTTPDQSTIILNDGSSITYDESGWNESRTISLNGEASFDVTEGVPFLVQTENGTVEVLGTTFTVRSWEDHLTVECYTGTVRVKYGTKEAVLTKGEAVKMSELENYPYTVDHAQPQWQNGMSTFKSESIVNVFKELGRQYKIEVIYEGDNLRFTGGFVHSDLRDALYQITGPLGLDYEIKADGIVRVFK